MKNKGLVVLSGGQDSTTTALFARKECKELHGVTFDYGQKHKIEIKFAVKIAKLLSILLVNFVLINLSSTANFKILIPNKDVIFDLTD